MKFNQKQIIFSLIGVLIGLLLTFSGIVTSGAGHGPYPRLSITILMMGGVIFILSCLVCIILTVMGLLGKNGFSINLNYKKTIPNYNWCCPKCDTVIQANTADCLECGYSTTS